MNDFEKILQAAQKSPVAENERCITRKSVGISAIVGLTVCIVMILVEWFVFKKFDFGKPFLIFLMTAISDLVEYGHLKKKTTLIRGVLEVVLALFCLLMYIGGLLS